MTQHANYAYPLNSGWSVEQMTAVVEACAAVETAYEQGISALILRHKLEEFLAAIPNHGEQRDIMRQFEQESGYSIYLAIKTLKNTTAQHVQLKPNSRGKQRE